MCTNITDHLLYILLATTRSRVFIEACAKCSPINTYYRVMIFECTMSCSQRSGNVGCLSVTQKNWLVNDLCKWSPKMLDGKFRSDWPFIINSKNSNLTKVKPDHNSKMAVKKFHNKDIR